MVISTFKTMPNTVEREDSSLPLLNPRKRITRADTYVDYVLLDMSEDGILNDVVLDDLEMKVQAKILTFESVAEIKLNNWRIKGLEFLHRHGKCALTISDDRLQVEALLRGTFVEFQCDGNIEFWNFRPCFRIGGYLENVRIYVNFNVECKTGLDAKLLGFRIEDMQIPYVSLCGFNPLSVFISQLLLTGVASILKEKIMGSLEDELRQKLSEVLPCYEFPPEGPFQMYNDDDLTTSYKLFMNTEEDEVK